MRYSRQLSILFWSVLALAIAPLTVLYFVQLWPLDHYQFFPVLILAVGMLFVARWDKQLQLPSSWLAWTLVAGGIASASLAAFYWSPWLAGLGLVWLLGAFLLSQNEEVPRRWGMLHLWPPCWLLLRLPLNLDYQLTGWLQTSTSGVSSHLLDRIGVIHRLTGNVFHLPKGTLFVEAACSGVQSVFAVLFCALLLVAWHRRSPVLLPIYIVAAILWAGIMNIVRVVVIAIAQEWWRVDLAHGWRHETLGYICLAMAVVLLLSTDRCLRVLFFPVQEDIDRNDQNPLRSFWNRMFASMNPAAVVPQLRRRATRVAGYAPTISLTVLTLSILVVFIPQVIATTRHYSEVRPPVAVEYWEPKSSVLDPVAGLRVIAFETFKDSANPTLGVNAHMWSCEIDGIPTRIVVSQHNEVHDLCNCYKGNGWRTLRRERRSSQEWDYIQADFVNSDTVFGTLLFSTLDSQARPVKLSSWSINDLFRARVNDQASPDQVSFQGISLNIQLWTVTETELPADVVKRLEAANEQIRQLIREDLAQAKQKK